AEEIAVDGAVPADKFIWHAVTRAVGNVKNQGAELIDPVT
ncbi:SOS response-associated peptidase, partial [Klebsiella pneumoniae]|nr:SOS response-associated peptidase [Klebsiella pneumoniae]